MTWMSTWTPPERPPKCDVHEGVRWSGDAPCFVCFPTAEAEGTTDHQQSIVPDPVEPIQLGVNQCAVLTNRDNDVMCRRPGSGRTVLGHALCDGCWSAVREIRNPFGTEVPRGDERVSGDSEAAA